MKCIAIDDEPLALKQLTDYISRVPFLGSNNIVVFLTICISLCK